MVEHLEGIGLELGLIEELIKFQGWEGVYNGMAEIVGLGFKARSKMIPINACEESIIFHGEKEFKKAGWTR